VNANAPSAAELLSTRLKKSCTSTRSKCCFQDTYNQCKPRRLFGQHSKSVVAHPCSARVRNTYCFVAAFWLIIGTPDYSKSLGARASAWMCRHLDLHSLVKAISQERRDVYTQLTAHFQSATRISSKAIDVIIQPATTLLFIFS
jgi:hypothetical protein